MASPPRSFDIVTPDTPDDRAAQQQHQRAASAQPPEWLRHAVRVWRECEELRAHCQRQREMLAEQREFLSGLSRQRLFGGEDPAREEAVAGRHLEEGTREGE